VGFKGNVGKIRVKGLKSTVGMTALGRVVFVVRMYIYVIVKKIWHST
jgi:hypothetical protein